MLCCRCCFHFLRSRPRRGSTKYRLLIVYCYFDHRIEIQVSLFLFCALTMNSRLAIQILGLVLALSEASAGFGRQRDEEQTVLQLIERIIPGRQKEFIVIIENDLATNGLDRFEFQTVNDTILQITATTGVAAAWGFNHYLKYFCKAHISWSGNQLSVPKPLPKVTKLTITSLNRLAVPYASWTIFSFLISCVNYFCETITTFSVTITKHII